MEGQITISEWMTWKEDLQRRLQEATRNFVGIGYRLRQIRDSGIYNGYEDVFDFARTEFGLDKSTVSRFIAINEKYSEGGNSLDLKEEYRNIGSSKLAEMLTLPDAECALITERTTVKEIRELKAFVKEDPAEVAEQVKAEEENAEPEEVKPVTLNNLQKCIFDFFGTPDKREILNKALALAEDLDTVNNKVLADLINPAAAATHKKGLVYMFLYDELSGVKYKDLTKPAPVTISWMEFFREMLEIYSPYYISGEDTWGKLYKEPEPEQKKEEQKQEPKKTATKPEKKEPKKQEAKESVPEVDENEQEDAEEEQEEHEKPIPAAEAEEEITENVENTEADEPEVVATSQQDTPKVEIKASITGWKAGITTHLHIIPHLMDTDRCEEALVQAKRLVEELESIIAAKKELEGTNDRDM